MVHVGFGNGGWVRIDEPGFPGPVYIRYKDERGRAVPIELYVDGRGEELRSDMFRDVDLGGFTARTMAGDSVWLPLSTSHPGPDLSRLASHFATGFGRQARHWVADSMRAQVKGAEVPQAPMGPEPDLSDEDDERPEPVRAPENGLTDDFLRAVAANYLWARAHRMRPAPFIKDQLQYTSVRTVHSWISKARDRGILPPTTPGRAG